MHIHILGICGTFMGGIAQLAREMGHKVTGSDLHVYPPMSDQLEASGIVLSEGYHASHLDPAPDLVVIGNAMSRGNEAVEYALDKGLPYTSGPAFLADHILPGRWVLAVAGTHGKTTTSSMLAWILEDAGLKPGFLIGGVPANFGISARLGETPFFVVEADEYDSAFFDKRSKFVHYRPRTAILNNLEFDHADIFPDLAAIQRQFHHLVRTIPGSGLIVAPGRDPALDAVFDMGCWTPVERFETSLSDSGPAQWRSHALSPDLSRFDVFVDGVRQGTVDWSQQGEHNLGNGLAAIAAARHAGVPAAISCEGLSRFKGVKRRMECLARIDDISVYDDFAHHPTAIQTTLSGLRQVVGEQRIICVLEMRSNTMKAGVHKDSLAPSLAEADEVILYEPPDLGWDLGEIAGRLSNGRTCHSVADIIAAITIEARPGDHILIMSNGSFDGLHRRLIEALNNEGGANHDG
ncbi:MAG: UDP-N-acetylmuramate:L-alanyl-gamma-D-glutamyl-meso-diaminopimelate ligase [Gammaproteobacteria bacterium]|nr:UDP-N-acetylmuramate:L-alanyl-gamma-D-glutamyl-meso-diaminopimelate ligase [Gammaproteobacteria bacterium]